MLHRARVFGPRLLVTLGVSSNLELVLTRLRGGLESSVERMYFREDEPTPSATFSDQARASYQNEVVRPIQIIKAAFKEIDSEVMELASWSDLKPQLAKNRFNGWLHIGHSENRGFQVAGQEFVSTEQLTDLLSRSSIELFDLRTCQNNLQVRDIRKSLPHLTVLGTGMPLDVPDWLEICAIFAAEMQASGDDYYVASQRVLIAIQEQISLKTSTT